MKSANTFYKGLVGTIALFVVAIVFLSVHEVHADRTPILTSANTFTIGTGITRFYQGIDASNNFGISATKNGSNVITSPYFTVAGSGFVGINNTAPAQFLDVNGSINFSTGSQLLQNGANAYYASSTQKTIFVGPGAGLTEFTYATSTTGSGNSSYASTFIGWNAGEFATTSGSFANTALGSAALTGVNAGTTVFQQDVAVGDSVMSGVTTGSFDTAIGHTSFQNLTTGTSNSGLGIQSGQQLTTGVNNTYLGATSGEWNQTGNGNVAIGQASLAGNGATNSNSNNVAIGLSAGKVTTTGSGNVYIGASTASTTNTGSNNICIGFDLSCPSAIANSSNTLDIGNLIFGNGITSQASSSPAGTFSIASSTNNFAAGLSFNTTNGVCHAEKAAGTATSYIYYYFTSAATQVIQTTPCSGSGTTTVIVD